MLEKRNLIRRNLTGGLGLGLFAGLLLALPDAVAMLFDFPGAGLWGAVCLLFFFDGVITAGMLGFFRGLVQAGAQKFAGSGAQSRAWSLWSRRALAASWASSIMPALPLDRASRWGVTLGFALVASWVLPEVVRLLGAAAEDRRRKGVVIAAASGAVLAGFFCTSHWGAMRLFPAPAFWFTTAFLLHMGALFFVARLIRASSRYHATWLSPLAGPGVVSIVLLLAMIGGSFARTRLGREEPSRLMAASRLAHRLHGAKEEPAGSADTIGRPPHGTSAVRVSDDPAPPATTAAPPVTLRLDPSMSVLVVTSPTARAPLFPSGVRVSGGVTASSDPELALGSFFTGRHLGMWARLAPHWPAPGPAWHQALAARGRVEATRFGRFEAGTAYLRELPDFGFPRAFEVPGISPLEAFLRTTDLVAKPFFAWVHLEGEADPDVVTRLHRAAVDGRFSVIWLHLPASGQVTISVLDPARKGESADFAAPFALPGVLPSLLPIPGHRTEFPSSPFPDVRHPRVSVTSGAEPAGTAGDVRRLERRIRHAVSRRPSERWPSTPEGLVPHLENLVCRGRIDDAELRRVAARVRTFANRPELVRRLELLTWRTGLAGEPPGWAHGLLAGPWVRAWSRLTGVGSGGPDPSRDDPDLLAWVLALSGAGLSERLLERCPGAPHTLPLLPGL